MNVSTVIIIIIISTITSIFVNVNMKSIGGFGVGGWVGGGVNNVVALFMHGT